MAKQTFTVGQVLTAAQLTNLQQTAMSGGAAQAKTSSYVLVATDAGTAISMTSTSATTVTVNTGLFAAGDTVFIQNLGSGNLTITAGTATVNTAGSLILPQYDAGILYFVSASSAIFYDYIQVGAVSPLTTKGDIYGFSTSDARIPIGANGTILTADSTESLGLKWATAAGGGGKVLQVVQGTYSTQTTIASTSMTDTGLTASITPSSASSKILIMVNQVLFYTRNANQLGVYAQILRGATSVYGGTTTFFEYDRDGAAGVVERWTAFSAAYLDSPSTTSSITYKTQGKLQTTDNSASSRWQPDGYTNNILLLEIGA